MTNSDHASAPDPVATVSDAVDKLREDIRAEIIRELSERSTDHRWEQETKLIDGLESYFLEHGKFSRRQLAYLTEGSEDSYWANRGWLTEASWGLNDAVQYAYGAFRPASNEMCEAVGLPFGSMLCECLQIACKQQTDAGQETCLNISSLLSNYGHNRP